MRLNHNTLIAYIAIFLIPISGLSIDIFTPALPIIEHALKTTPLAAQYTVSCYMISFGLSQLLWGPMSDIYGRKTVLLIGLYTFLLSCTCVTVVTDIVSFIVWRTIQGIAVGAMMTGCRTLIIDLFRDQEYKNQSYSCTLAWSLSPVFGPLLGATIIQHFNWKACFYTLNIYSLIALIFVHRYVTTNTLDIPKPNIHSIHLNTRTLFKNKHYIIALAVATLSFSSLTVFQVTGPFIVQETLQHSPEFYGLCASLVGLGWLLGNLIVKSCSIKKIHLKVQTLAILLPTACFMIYLVHPHLKFLHSYLILLTCCTLTSACLFSLSLANCLNESRCITGTASSIAITCIWVCTGIIATGASYINISTPTPMFILYILLSLLIFSTQVSGYMQKTQ